MNIMALPGKCAILRCANPRAGLKVVQVTHKGYASLLKVSQRRGDNIFNPQGIPSEGPYVHKSVDEYTLLKPVLLQ